MRLNGMFKLFVLLPFLALVAGCAKEVELNHENDDVRITLDIDQVSLESASIRVRHDGPSDFLWVYMNTSDLESDAASLIETKVA